MSDAANPVNDGEITLREAIGYVNGDPVPLADQTAFDFVNLGTNDKITFAPSLDGGTITLTSGEIGISEEVTIDATALTSGLTIDAAGNSRIFDINITATGSTDSEVALRGLTFSGGDTFSMEDALRSRRAGLA